MRTPILSEPVLTKTHHMLTGIAPELLPRLRALRTQLPHTSTGLGTLQRADANEILSALRDAARRKQGQPALLVLLESAWSRACRELGTASAH